MDTLQPFLSADFLGTSTWASALCVALARGLFLKGQRA